MIRLEHAGVRWELQPDFEPLLGEVLAAPGQVVSEQPPGVISLRTAQGKKFLLTETRRAGTWSRLGAAFRKGPTARDAWQAAQQLAALPVAIVRHLAFGEKPGGASVLIREAFDGVPLDEAAAQCSDAIYEFFNQLYRRGVTILNPRPDDVLVRLDPLEIRLANLDRVALQKEVSEAERLKLLAFLRAFLPLKVPRDVERESENVRRAWLATRARRSLESDREFSRRELGKLRWRVRVAGGDSALEPVLRDPDTFLERDAWIMQRSDGVTLGGAPGVALKRFDGRRGARGSGLRGLPSGLRHFCLARLLELAGVPTPRPLACGQREASSRSYFLMEEIPQAKSLRQWEGDAREAVRRVGEVLGGLHRAGLSHENLRETNFIFDAAGRFYLVGFDGLSLDAKLFADRALADLNRLVANTRKLHALTKSERITFLHAYCRARHIRAGDLFTRTWQVRSLAAVRRESRG
ncbi:MAG: hypothetical protein HZA90_03575 [Verrucomicrobia bacterium]|nr:hypothetical protein [Verrucomicrobiota bacterium]